MHCDYSNKVYWEQRYSIIQKSTGAHSPSIAGSDKQSDDNRTSESKSVYEWYVSLDHIFPLLQEDIRLYRDRVSPLNSSSPIDDRIIAVEVLVSGCGNSLLCEELWKKSK